MRNSSLTHSEIFQFPSAGNFPCPRSRKPSLSPLDGYGQDSEEICDSSEINHYHREHRLFEDISETSDDESISVFEIEKGTLPKNISRRRPSTISLDLSSFKVPRRENPKRSRSAYLTAGSILGMRNSSETRGMRNTYSEARDFSYSEARDFSSRDGLAFEEESEEETSEMEESDRRKIKHFHRKNLSIAIMDEQHKEILMRSLALKSAENNHLKKRMEEKQQQRESELAEQIILEDEFGIENSDSCKCKVCVVQ